MYSKSCMVTSNFLIHCVSGLWQDKILSTTFYHFLHHRQWNILQLWNLCQSCSDIGYHHQHYQECSLSLQQTVVLSQKLSMNVSNDKIDILFWKPTDFQHDTAPHFCPLQNNAFGLLLIKVKLHCGLVKTNVMVGKEFFCLAIGNDLKIKNNQCNVIQNPTTNHQYYLVCRDRSNLALICHQHPSNSRNSK